MPAKLPTYEDYMKKTHKCRAAVDGGGETSPECDTARGFPHKSDLLAHHHQLHMSGARQQEVGLHLIETSR